MIRLNYILTIPVVCILLELIQIINLVAILIQHEYTWMLNLIYLGFNFDVVPLIDILLILNTVVSLIIELLLILWFSIEDSDDYYTRKIGYLWIILGCLFLTNILLFAAISDGYTLPLKSSPRIGSYLFILSSIIAQITIFLIALGIGIFLVVNESKSSKVKKLKLSRKMFKQKFAPNTL